MAIDTKGILSVLAVALVGGLAMYFSQFLTAGPSPESMQVMQVQRELISTAIVGLAAVMGYIVIDGDDVRDSVLTIAVVFLLAGIVGFGIGFGALWMSPPDGFSLGSKVLTYILVVFQEVVPFSLAGFAGATVHAIE
jgi:hypothetical protein